jgi:hypothetical protein
MPSKSLYWHTFGSLTNALRERIRRGRREERLERALDQGVLLAAQLGGCRSSPTGRGEALEPRHPDRVAGLPHVRLPARRLVDVPFLLRERLLGSGVEVTADGALA